MGEINTYGELLAEIDRVEKYIEEVKHQMGYEQGDEFDLELYLIELKRTKRFNDKLDELQLGNFCYECNSTNIVKDKYRNIERLTDVFRFECKDCGCVRIVEVSKDELFKLMDIKIGIWGFF